MTPAFRLGVFIVPDATDGALTVEQIMEPDRCGLDLVGVQDHPYQRDPATIERVVNVMTLDGEPGGWPDQLARIADELRFSTLLITVPPDDPLTFVRRLGEDTAPRVRALLR